MDFEITNPKLNGRTGRITFSPSVIGPKNAQGNVITNVDAQSGENGTMETPNVLTFAKYGRLPHLTGYVEQFAAVERTPSLKKLRLCELMEGSLTKGLQSSGQGYEYFTSSPANSIYFCSVQDSAKISGKDTSKYAEDKFVSVWTTGGRRKIAPEDFMNALSLARVPFAEALCDVTTSADSVKRVRKSVDRTLRYLDRCIELKHKNQSKYPTDLFAAIVGGGNVKERVRCAAETAKRDVQGFVLEGFENLGEKFYDVLKETLRYLPSDKIKILLGIFSPDEVIDAVSLGMDLVDNSCVFDVSSRGCAMIFEFSHKKRKLHDNSLDLPAVATNCDEAEKIIEICLVDSSFKEDFKPLVDGCNCYACLKYTRAYLNHLLVANEMLAQVLLMIHNTHHFKGFVAELRNAIGTETLSSLRDMMRRTKT